MACCYICIVFDVTMLAVRPKDEIEKKALISGFKTGRTIFFYVRETIMGHWEDLEDYFLAVHWIENPLERIRSLEELENGLDLES